MRRCRRPRPDAGILQLDLKSKGGIATSGKLTVTLSTNVDPRASDPLIVNPPTPPLKDNAMLPSPGSKDTHNRVDSLSNTLTRQLTDDSSISTADPLPLGWEKQYTLEGRAFYLDHNGKITTWVDPRRQIAVCFRAPDGEVTTRTQTVAQLIPLPPRWEMRLASGNRLYFVDHDTGTTTWYYPHCPRPARKAAAIPAEVVPYL